MGSLFQPMGGVNSDKALTQLPIHKGRKWTSFCVVSSLPEKCCSNASLFFSSSSPRYPPPQFQAQSPPSTCLPLSVSATILCPHPPSAKPSFSTPHRHPSCTKRDNSISTSRAMHVHQCLGVLSSPRFPLIQMTTNNKH